MRSPAPDFDEPFCRPSQVLRFKLEHHLAVDGIHADIRRFNLDQFCTGRFRANSFYIGYALAPRPRTRLLSLDRKPTLSSGEIVFLPNGVEFVVQCGPGEQHLLCLTFETERAKRVFDIEDLEYCHEPCLDVRDPCVRYALTRLADEVSAPGFASEILVECVALALTVDLRRYLSRWQSSEDSRRGQMAEWRLRRLKDYIEANISGSLSVVGLAAESGVSPRHLVRTFKATAGVTLSDYIAAVRIRTAKQALAEEGALVKLVATQCGFQSPAAFSAAFRKTTGMSPREYRRELRCLEA